jgi:hypothetical protein
VGVEGKSGIIIGVTITRGETIKVSISRTNRYTQGINKIENSCPEDSKIQTLTGR